MGERRRRYSAANGVVRTLITDDDTPDKFVVKTTMDVEPILDSIHRDRELMPHGVNKLVARLPVFIHEDLEHRGITKDPDRLKAWLNSDEAAPWRVWQGIV